jgi:hypothetical protein
VSRKNCSARTRACRVHTRVNAGRVFARVRALRQPFTPFWVGARPGIVLDLCHQPRLYRIPLDVPRDPVPFTFIPHPAIVRFAPPERLSCASQQLIRFPRRKSLERLKELARRYQRKQQHVDVVCHDRKRSKLVMTEFPAFKERIDYPLRDRVLLEEHGAGASFVEVAVHPHEGFASSTFARRREPGRWQAAVQVPSDEQPAVLWVDVGKAALNFHFTISAIWSPKISVAHALVRAVFAHLRTEGLGRLHDVHTSVNAARTSACATIRHE